MADYEKLDIEILKETIHLDLTSIDAFTKAGYVGYATWNALASEVVRFTKYHKRIQ